MLFECCLHWLWNMYLSATFHWDDRTNWCQTQTGSRFWLIWVDSGVCVFILCLGKTTSFRAKFTEDSAKWIQHFCISTFRPWRMCWVASDAVPTCPKGSLELPWEAAFWDPGTQARCYSLARWSFSCPPLKLLVLMPAMLGKTYLQQRPLESPFINTMMRNTKKRHEIQRNGLEKDTPANEWWQRAIVRVNCPTLPRTSTVDLAACAFLSCYQRRSSTLPFPFPQLSI